MSITIKTVATKRDLKTFVRFANRLYKGNRYYVPCMPFDDMNTLRKETNAAFDFCEAELYLAYKNDKISLSEFLVHAINRNWIDFKKLLTYNK